MLDVVALRQRQHRLARRDALSDVTPRCAQRGVHGAALAGGFTE